VTGHCSARRRGFESMKYFRQATEGEWVHVYRNLHKRCWSVRSKGKLIAQVDAIQLGGCTCHVREAARQIVIARKCRSVHAYVKGRIHHGPFPNAADCVATIVYRPYVSGDFFDPVTSAPVGGAEHMVFSEAGKVYCHGVISRSQSSREP
jgi:hypothetical protein